MRKAYRFAWLIVVLATVVSSGCVDVDFSSDFNANSDITFPSASVLGSGVVAQENRSVFGFTGVVLAGRGHLLIEQGDFEELVVKAEDNLLPHIITDAQHGILEIRNENNVNLRPTQPIEYHLTVVSLESVLLSGAGNITVSNLMTPQLGLTLSGVGKVEVTNLEADELEAVLSGVGNFDISGTVDVQRLKVTGIGEYDARDLISLDAVISIVGNDDQMATVQVGDMLTVTILGNGRVFYIGNPFVYSDISGSGNVQQILE